MSWLFSRVLVEEFLEDISLDGERSAPLSETPTPQAYCSQDKMTNVSRLSRFGMTFAPLTESRGKALLTSYLEDFHAKTSASPDEAQDLKGNGLGYGLRCLGLLAKFDQSSSSWKTPQLSLIEEGSESLQTLPRWGMAADGELWELATSERLISEKGFGLLPTPLSSDYKRRGPNSKQQGLPEYVTKWPTPTVCGNYNRKGASKTSGDGLATAVKKWLTPTAHNAKEGAYPAEYRRKTPTLGAQAGGALNPTWVEWLMGWPLGWTDLKPLETDRFQQWQQQHSES